MYWQLLHWPKTKTLITPINKLISRSPTHVKHNTRRWRRNHSFAKSLLQATSSQKGNLESQQPKQPSSSPPLKSPFAIYSHTPTKSSSHASSPFTLTPTSPVIAKMANRRNSLLKNNRRQLNLKRNLGLQSWGTNRFSSTSSAKTSQREGANMRKAFRVFIPKGRNSEKANRCSPTRCKIINACLPTHTRHPSLRATAPPTTAQQHKTKQRMLIGPWISRKYKIDHNPDTSIPI